MISILFTAGPSLLSKAIRGVTNEPVSHVAIKSGLFVIHSNLLGIHIELAVDFESHVQVIYELPIKEFDQDMIFKKLEGKEFTWYDYGALLFAGISLLARRYLCLPLPKNNLWQSSGMYMCTEWIQLVLGQEIDSMITPYKLYLQLKEQYK